MTEMKIKAKKLKRSDLDRIKQLQINKAKAFLESCPFATPIYMALKTKLPIEFILNNRKEIGV